MASVDTRKMQLTVVLAYYALALGSVAARPWSPSDPMQPSLYQLLSKQKERNLAKIQLLPRNAVSFVGPRQATSLEEEDELEELWGYYDEDENTPQGYGKLQEYGEDDAFGWF